MTELKPCHPLSFQPEQPYAWRQRLKDTKPVFWLGRTGGRVSHVHAADVSCSSDPQVKPNRFTLCGKEAGLSFGRPDWWAAYGTHPSSIDCAECQWRYQSLGSWAQDEERLHYQYLMRREAAARERRPGG